MINIEKIEYIDKNLCDLVRYIDNKFNERYNIVNSKLHIDEFILNECFVQFDFSNDYHFMIKFVELFGIIQSKMKFDTYVQGLYFQIERDYLKATIMK